MECGDKEWQHCQVEKMGCPGCYYNEIEIGEYVRTKAGNIDKIKSIKQNEILFENSIIKYTEENIKNMVVKHSKDILDLIEVGDVLKIKEDNSICYIGLEKDETTLTYQEIIDEIKNNKIKLLAIVTKEKFRNIEYKIKEVE